MRIKVVEKDSGRADTESRRQHVRADDKIPVYYELFSGDSDQRTGLKWESIFDEIDPEAEENPRLYELLFDISQKLNILINHMDGKSGFKIPEAKEVNISGGGMRFSCQDRFQVGDMLMLKTFLPTYAHIINLKCEVVRAVELEGGGSEVSVKYVDMDEATREKIIRYIFSKQRRHLRNERTKRRTGH
jgi:hypothetical protein